MSKKYSELTVKEFMQIPIGELARMERAEFPEHSDAITRLMISEIMARIQVLEIVRDAKL